MKWYGNAIYRIRENGVMTKPEVGMGVTECLWSDRDPWEVIEVVSDKKIRIRALGWNRVDDNGMSDCQKYEFFSKPDGEVKTLVLRNGRWRDLKKEWHGEEMVETRRLGASGWRIGRADRYYDFSF